MPASPLDGVLVLEFCQYLSGPSASLRLADLGARVIKIESPRGDACRGLAIQDLWASDGSSLLFHTINRNKESFTANLKDDIELALVRRLVEQADVLIHNFRPGVMEKLGLGYEELSALTPKLIYGEISGYGAEGEWSKKPGQDLLVQAKSGLMFSSGSDNNPPVPFGLAIADMICGAQLVQGILAALIHREKSGQGVKLELSLLESILDLQFESLTTYFNSGKTPTRSKISNGHPLLGAPYGIYQTLDGFIAIAMVDLDDLGKAIELNDLQRYQGDDKFDKRDEIKELIAIHLGKQSSAYWMAKFREFDLWSMELHDWKQLTQRKGYKAVEMELTIGADHLKTTRCPIRIDGEKLVSGKPAPKLGADTQQIIEEFAL